jgi:hypothetical protein
LLLSPLFYFDIITPLIFAIIIIFFRYSLLSITPFSFLLSLISPPRFLRLLLIFTFHYFRRYDALICFRFQTPLVRRNALRVDAPRHCRRALRAACHHAYAFSARPIIISRFHYFHFLPIITDYFSFSLPLLRRHAIIAC